MFKLHKVAVLGVVVLAALTVGCQKHVELRINNLTPEPLMVELRAPGIGWTDLGPIPPGAMLKYDLKIDNQDLSAECVARAPKHRPAPFLVTKETESPMYIDFKSWGPPQVRDKHTAIDETVDKKTPKVPIHTEEVIE